MTAHGCRLQGYSAQSVNAAGAQITFRSDGRVGRVALMENKESQACATAARTLMMTFVTPVELTIEEGRQALLMVPFSTQFAACQDAPSPAHLPRVNPLADGVHESFPRIATFAKPVYPVALWPKEGDVKLKATVSPRGCVHTAAVVESVHPLMDWIGAWTAIGFTFKPASDVETDVQVNIIISFSVKK